MSTAFHKVSKEEWGRMLPEGVELEIWMSLYDDIQLPQRKTKWSSGYDFHAPYTIVIEPQEEEVVPTGIKIELNPNQELLIFPRSGLGFKHYLRLANTIGKIDADYFGNPANEGHILVKIRNEGTKSLTINKGEGFCQGTIYEYCICDNDSFEEGATRQGGFGSTTGR